MNRAAILSFSERGAQTAQIVGAALEGSYDVSYHAPKGNLKALTAELFPDVQALIFVSACGIAVRAISPLIVNKTVDPAVLVIDEGGQYVISLLSGHIGGANDLARRIAEAIGATPVITTATDVNHRFSADAWAARRGFGIDSMDAAKRFSAEILKRDLPLFTDLPIQGALPPGLYLGQSGDVGLSISCKIAKPFDTTLLIVPKRLHVGVGCRRGIEQSAIREAVTGVLSAAKLNINAVKDISSIDVKKDEEGLLAFAREQGLPLTFYTAEELNALQGDFSASAFVQKTVGVDNVCERAAARSAGDGYELIVRKTSRGGVTVAVAQEKGSVSFE